MHPLVKLAKQAVETYIKEQKTINPPDNLPEEVFKEKAGVFVTITKSGKLRGCIGTFLPTQKNIAQETIRSAIAAASEDWRFGAIQEEELPYLHYEVSVLSKPERINSLSELNPKKYGVIVQSAENPFKKGLLLPNLEGVSTIEKQISIAAQKGGINLQKEKIVVHRFTIKKYE
ncbi:AmmeMemoRadiSam system protein A [bacterium]|nr:AmmeMemoRadiSam system protein A [bacterium]